jgi:cysteine desulfurase
MAKRERIYMDHNATTPLDPRVFDAMRPWLTDHFGNPSSATHEHGRQAREAVEAARAKVAALIGAESSEIVFTSGATEADNLAILGAASRLRGTGNHIVTSRIEHKAVLDTCAYLEANGFEVTRLPVDRYARVDPADVERAITDRTILVSIMYVNSEVGTIEPVEEIGAIARKRGVLFHCDAVQAVGKIEVDVGRMRVDLLAMSSHKMYGPKGVGALYVRRGVRIDPLLHGGGQERGLRPGTLNTPAIVGFGEACALRRAEMGPEAERLKELRERLWRGIEGRIGGVHRNGHPELRQPGNLNVSFECVEGESLILSMRDVALSSGSACTSDSLETSYVLAAMGGPDALAHGSVRFGLGRGNTEAEVDEVVDRLEENVKRLREMSPLLEGG